MQLWYSFKQGLHLFRLRADSPSDLCGKICKQTLATSLGPPQSQHAVHEYRSSPPPPSLIALTCVRAISHIFQLHTPKTDSGYICEVRINQDPRIRKFKTKIKSTIPTKLKSNCKSLPFFYFLTFEKADCSLFALLVGWMVGRRHHYFFQYIRA